MGSPRTSRVTPAGSALITPGAKLGRARPSRSCAASAWITNEPRRSLAPAAGPGATVSGRGGGWWCSISAPAPGTPRVTRHPLRDEMGNQSAFCRCVGLLWHPPIKRPGRGSPPLSASIPEQGARARTGVIYLAGVMNVAITNPKWNRLKIKTSPHRPQPRPASPALTFS